MDLFSIAFNRSALARLASFWSCTIVILVLLLSSSGCVPSDELGRHPISGKVTFDGKPLDDGYILFRVTGEGTSAGATIANGSFDVPAKNGISYGQYQVEITSEQKTAQTVERDPADWGDQAAGQVEHVVQQIIPDRYNANSELKLIVDGPPEPQNYDLTK